MHAPQANPGRHFSPPVDFLFQESLTAQADLVRYITQSPYRLFSRGTAHMCLLTKLNE